MEEKQDEFPRGVLIQRTLETAIAEMGDYDESEEADLRLGMAIGESRHEIEIEFWEEIPETHDSVSHASLPACGGQIEGPEKSCLQGRRSPHRAKRNGDT